MKTDRDTIIGKKIQYVRELRGITQREMAQRLHIEQSTYSKLENGETKLDVERLTRIAGELGMKPEDLLNPDPIVVHVEHISGGANGYQPRVEQQFPEEFIQRLTDRYEAHVKELQQMNTRLLDLLEN